MVSCEALIGRPDKWLEVWIEEFLEFTNISSLGAIVIPEMFAVLEGSAQYQRLKNIA